MAVFVGLYFLARRLVVLAEKAGQLQTRTEFMLRNTEPVLKLAHSLMSELKEAKWATLPGRGHINAITEMAKDQSGGDQESAPETLRLWPEERSIALATRLSVQNTLAVAADQFERTTAMVQHSVLEPAREFSYVMFGVRRAIEVFMTGNRLPVNRVYQDEEMFI
ncbi:MAG: hypothetical protein IPL01_22980 [Acidobacteria bacterium]|nr:hypothetical protein [Acidobacteriota bacterium]